ncbi:MAG: class I SAM-dependent methyltransferase [Actinomycetota bacterium]|nr:MAG: class I SAM-dependent methyltransferase [Actinomycetota bacterium]
MSTTTSTAPTADTGSGDRALKAKHRGMWAMGDYPAVAHDVIADLGPALVAAAGVTAGQQVLDVAAGSGNAAIPAAAQGARVIASDLTPELFAAGQADAARAGVQLGWQEADAEDLPWPASTFDVVLSCVGVMFAPHHQAAADELARVCRPGGTIAVLSWTPAGFIGQMFAAMKPYVPAPPPGTQPPVLWGDEQHVRQLLGDRVIEVEARRATLRVDCFATPAQFRDFFKRCYGPTIAAYRGIADDAARVAALDADLVELSRRFDTGDGERLVMDWEYLLLTARRAA